MNTVKKGFMRAEQNPGMLCSCDDEVEQNLPCSKGQKLYSSKASIHCSVPVSAQYSGKMCIDHTPLDISAQEITHFV